MKRYMEITMLGLAVFAAIAIILIGLALHIEFIQWAADLECGRCPTPSTDA